MLWKQTRGKQLSICLIPSGCMFCLAGCFRRFFLQMCSVRYQPAAAEAKQRLKYVACSLLFFGNALNNN